MANETPAFWRKQRSALSALLAPAAWVYGRCAERAMEKAAPRSVDAPVLCIGNFTLGGTGKTPLAIAFAAAAKKRKLKPGIVSRGFGGARARQRDGLHKVDIKRDRAREVGDEPLLLAEHAPVIIGVNRFAAAEKLLAEGVNFIIMDDGFQSRRLHFDYALLAADAERGLGNGKIFPAGPLRAPLPVQMAYADGVVMTGAEPAGKLGGALGAAEEELARLAARAGKPFYSAHFSSFISRAYEGSGSNAAEEQNRAPIHNLRAVKNRRFLAFAGIGSPEKFYRSLEALGGEIAQRRSFADHHFFNSYDIEDITRSARAHRLVIATTAKDYARLKTDNMAAKLGDILVLDVRLRAEREDFCGRVLDMCRQNYKNRICRRL